MTPSAEGQEAPAAFLDKMLAGFAARHRQAPQRPHRGRSFACRRLTAIERLIYGRHRGPVDTDDGQAYVEAALPYLAANAVRHRHPITLAAWAQRLTPRFYDEMGPAWFEGRETGLRGVAFATADQLARQLAVTYAEVCAFGLSTVGAVDRPKHLRLVERKEKDRLRQKAKRAAAGSTPRELSQAALKPWAALGISEATWRRRGKPTSSETVRLDDGTSSTPIKGCGGVRTKRRHDGSLTKETTTPKPWAVQGVSRATWYRNRATAAAAPDLDHANDDRKLTSARTIKVELVEKVPSNSNNKNSSKTG